MLLQFLKGMQPELESEMKVFKVLEKILPYLLTVLFACGIQLLMVDQDKFFKFLDIGKFLVELGIFLTMLKLLNVGTVLQFLMWKSYGNLAKLEFALVCQGGNVNKLLSIAAQKLKFLELRAQEMRADASDIGRSITTYLCESSAMSVAYLQEGVRRIAKSWVESRRVNKDLDPAEFEAAWNQIKKSGFQHAIDSYKEFAAKFRALNKVADAETTEEQIAKFEEVFANPTEELEKY